MKLYDNPGKSEWASICLRPVMEVAALTGKVQAIMTDVQERGDAALLDYARQFDGVSLDSLVVSPEEIAAAEGVLPAELKTAIRQAARNIRRFHEAQVEQPVKIETMPGVVCWRRSVGIEKVGLYVPGGTAPLFSTVLMLAIPAAIAGCKEVVLCTPPQKDGNVHPAVLFSASIAGVGKIIKCGGAQAIASFTYGTESVPKVFKIFGPGNQYVTAAKQLAQQQGLAIDMPAGPSEVCVLADETAEPAFVAADLLSQAEHGPDSQVLLVTTDSKLPGKVQAEIERQAAILPRKAFALQSLENSRVVVMDDLETAIGLVNVYAAEHLIISTKDVKAVVDKIINAGSIFLGNYSPESVGDYASGTNHTLPTNGYAAMYSGVSVDSFVKKITVQELSREGLQAIAGTVEQMAMAEGLEAHANAVTIRLNN